MSKNTMDKSEPLDYEDIGHLLVAKGRKLENGEDDPEVVIREVLETLARSQNTRSRAKAVDMNGRVSVGRDLSGVHGLTLFQPDPKGEDRGQGDEDGS